MNEFDLINSFVKEPKDPSVYLGPGDDASVVPLNDREFLISTTDCLVENIHFKKEFMSFSELGYKSLAVNISDIAAMGGKPCWAHMSLALPEVITKKDVATFYEGFYNLAQSCSIDLIGGDTVASSGPLFINIHLQGTVPKSDLMTRKDFSHADYVCVIGSLGDSAAGLKCLFDDNKEQNYLINKHLTPPILVEQAQWLSKQVGCSGMMDLSDGLWSDLQRLPPIGIEIDLDKIPHSPALIDYCRESKQDIFQFSIAGGEDYQLLFGCQKENLQDLSRHYQTRFGEGFTVIGQITKDEQKPIFVKQKIQQDLSFKAFSHF